MYSLLQIDNSAIVQLNRAEVIGLTTGQSEKEALQRIATKEANNM
jgi:hypothetical protein